MHAKSICRETNLQKTGKDSFPHTFAYSFSLSFSPQFCHILEKTGTFVSQFMSFHEAKVSLLRQKNLPFEKPGDPRILFRLSISDLQFIVTSKDETIINPKRSLNRKVSFFIFILCFPTTFVRLQASCLSFCVVVTRYRWLSNARQSCVTDPDFDDRFVMKYFINRRKTLLSFWQKMS